MPMSMLSRLFTAGSTATAAKAATTAANELGAAQSAGIGCGHWRIDFVGLGWAGPEHAGRLRGHGPGHDRRRVVRADRVDRRGAPRPALRAARRSAALFRRRHAGAHSGMPPMMPITAMGGRDAAPPPTRFELRSTVIPFTPAAG